MWLPLAVAIPAYARRNAAKVADWPQFRGPNAAGVSPEASLPEELGPANLRWKTAMPAGNSSPVVWGDRIFLTAFRDSKRLVVLCVDRRDGRVRWEREVPAGRTEIVHPLLGSPASSTPVTDGQRVFAFFGAVGLVAFDFRGRLLWRHELGPLTYNLGWGAASSPILYGDTVILNCDHDGESFLVAVDKATGKEKWRKPRPGAPPSYSTPILWEVEGRPQLITAGSGRVTAYDAATGQELWHVAQPGGFTATTPVAAPGLLIAGTVDHTMATGEYSASLKATRRPNFDALFANHDGNRDGKLSPQEVPQMRPPVFERIDANRDGFLSRQELDDDFDRQQPAPAPAPTTGTNANVLMGIRPGGQVAWRVAAAAPYVASPLQYREHVYIVAKGGIMSCFAAGGKLVWKQRVAGPGDYYASPVAGDGKIYLASEEGEVTVLAAGPDPKMLGRRSLGERCMATPAIAGGRIYVRTDRGLYCFGR
ncbi:MAG: PQQ-binding-like beta-propeller repeat protein [Acidobacteria bacterium]|nr:PQQ-binding-like beta-propeller repeat protein [Acidobacteriota bacterium]